MKSKIISTIFLLPLAFNLMGQEAQWKNPIDKEILDATKISVSQLFYGKGNDFYEKWRASTGHKEVLGNKAMENYLQAIKVDSTFAEAYQSLGLIFYQTGDIANAEKYLRKAAVLYPYKAGLNYYLLKDYDTATKYFKQARDSGFKIPEKIVNELKL